MTNATDRRQILALVNEARRNGARLYRICQELGIGKTPTDAGPRADRINARIPSAPSQLMR